MIERSLKPPISLPDLGGLAPHSVRMAARRIFQSGGAQEHIPYVLQLNAVRLADSCIREYELGREAVRQYHEERESLGIGYLLRASCHFENCIWHLERFTKHSIALRSDRSAPGDLKALIPRTLSFLDKEGLVTQLRHTLAHMERDALNGALPQGSNIMLLAVSDGLEVGSHLLSWADLEILLRDVHACASALADYLPPASRA